MKFRAIKILKNLGLKLRIIWFALSAFFIYTSIDMAIHHEIPQGFMASQVIIANTAFFLAGFVFYFS